MPHRAIRSIRVLFGALLICATIIMIIMAWLLVQVGVSSGASAKPRARTDIKTYQQEVTVPAPKWIVTPHQDGTRHVSCSASRQVTPSQSVFVIVSVSGRILIDVGGVKFSEKLPGPYQWGLVAVDDNVPLEVPVYQANAWNTTFDIAKPPADLSDQLAHGQELKLLLADRIYKLSLVDSYRAMNEIKDCNARGQERLNRKRLSDAKPADVRAG